MMTLREAKDITSWMQEHGVLRFSVDGLSVDFMPRMNRPNMDDRKPPETQEPGRTFQGMDEDMLLRSA